MNGRGAQVISSVLPWAGTGVQAEADASYGSILGFVACHQGFGYKYSLFGRDRGEEVEYSVADWLT